MKTTLLRLAIRAKTFLVRNKSSLTQRCVLGIESSCDDTGAAVVDENGTVLGEDLKSQMKIHLENGGVIPHIAMHLHKENIKDVVTSALDKSGVTLQDISAIAVTTKPGLGGSLLVGIEYAKHLAAISKKPLIPVHHMEAHALTIRLLVDVQFPFLVLLASGGHCQVALVKNIEEFYLLGSSQHNSPGEVLDKIARRLKLQNLPECYEMSGGHAIEYIAQNGDPSVYPVPQIMTHYRDCNFSFSGFSSYAHTVIEEEEEKYGVSPDGVIPTAKDFCASLLHGYAIHMMHRVQRAFVYCEENRLLHDERTLVFSGGVACNSYIRSGLKHMCDTVKAKFYAPSPKYCTDNGVMVAWNGMEKLKANLGISSNLNDVKPDPDCPLGIDLRNSVQKASIKVKTPRFNVTSEDKDSLLVEVR